MTNLEDPSGWGFTDANGTDAWGVGPNRDGTYSVPDTAIKSQPVDVGGGPPADYGQQVLDVFKYGVNAWSQTQARKDFLDYKRYEATQNGLYMQGRPAMLAAARTGGVSGLALTAAVVIVAVALLTHR